MGLAAVLILSLTLWLVIASPTRNPAPELATVLTDATSAKERLIVLATQLHLQSPQLSVKTSQPGRIETELAGYLPDPVQVPLLGDEYVLIGAVATTLNGKRVVVTRWQHQGRQCSLYQFCPSEFDLPMDLPAEEFVTNIESNENNRYRIKLWSQGHCAYALVGRCTESMRPVQSLSDPI